MSDYQAFLASKAITDAPTGLSAPCDLAAALFDFQRDITSWALKRGRAAIFAGTGLGKSFMELAWADVVFRETGRDILHLAPLAVTSQMAREAEKFGLSARQVRSQSDVAAGNNIVNFQKLEHFDLSHFGGVILDVIFEAYQKDIAARGGSASWDFEKWKSILIWQRYAAPVWNDIDQTRTLQYRGGRDEKDEVHISPLQLDVIERCIDLWSIKGETVLTPFLGIGSEVFSAVEMGRKGLGIELKPSYFRQAVKNIAKAGHKDLQSGLFEAA